MLATWKQLTLESVCSRITDGSHSSPPSVPDGRPMASVKDLTPFGIRLESCRLIPHEDFEKLVRQGCQPVKGDVLIAKDGATALDTVCEVKRNDDVVLLSSVAILRPNPSVIDSSFLHYYLDSSTTRSYLKGTFISGAAIPRVVLKDLKRAAVLVPPLPTQRRIAGILSAYDELIENNQRRIRILEEMARSLYREWFVHFRYPGHESVPLVDSPLGRIPQGWEVKSLGALMLEQIGGGWGKDVPDEKHTEPAWVIRGTDIPDARTCQVANVPHRFHSISNLRSRRLQAWDIIFEVSGGSKGQPVGRTLLVAPQLLSALGDDAVICASFCKRICPDMGGYGSEMLYLSFLEGYESGEIEQFQVQSTGISNFKWTEYLEKIERVIPPESVRMRFRDLVRPMLSQAATLGLQTANLRRTRDLLLPRLLSGQIALATDTLTITA